jgi:6-phosphogluconate dehydrogenase
MQLGLIGLGRMGGNMRDRLRAAGHEVVGYDHHKETTDVASLAELVEKLAAPRVIWTMVPAGQITESTIDELAGLMSDGDIIIDGGNSKFTDDAARAERLKPKGISYLDCGVSGGIWGITNGYALMVGGDAATVAHCQPIFDALKPAGEYGFAHAGTHGAGHYAKMIHNGVEYAMLAAYGEGFEILHRSEYDFDLHQVAHLWNQASVVRSWLLELAERAFERDATLEHVRGYVEDSGEGRWTVAEAIDLDVPAPVITLSLLRRFASRQEESYSAKVIAALRAEFGGHRVLVE